MADAADREEKPGLDRYAMMRQVYEAIGDRYEKEIAAAREQDAAYR
jgi:hypothetical protein